MQRIYLDHNSTTPLDPRVAERMADAYREGLVNPASQHADGRQARRRLEAARDYILETLGGDPQRDRLLLTSGGTESNNLAILGIAGDAVGRVIVSAVEHPSVRGAATELARRGFEVVELGVNDQGVVSVDDLKKQLTPDTRLVSVMLGNNETGAVQPIEELAACCAAAEVPMHTDAVQAVGKRPVHFRRLGASALSFSGHKFHAPTGIGGLLVRGECRLAPLMFGGFQQLGLRPGTETVVPALGLAEALRIGFEDSGREERMGRLRDQLETRLLADPAAGAVINSASTARLPHTTNVSFPGLDRQALLMALDLAGVSCSTGSACASGSSEPSPVLLAMGLDPARIEGALRLSLGAVTTAAEVQQAADRILLTVNNLRSRPGNSKKPGTSRFEQRKGV